MKLSPSISLPKGSRSYPAIQPLGRTLIGLWLWTAPSEEAPLPTRFQRER